MIFIDTSVWVDYLRGGDPRIKQEIDELLDDDRVALAAPVRLELLSGVRKDQQRVLRRLLSALPTYRPSDSAWKRMEGWVMDAARTGVHFGVGDLLVAGIAAENASPVWSLDGDFERMGSLDFIDLHRLT